MGLWRDERKDYGDKEQHDDDPLEQFHTLACDSIRNFFVDAFERFEFSQNTRIPFGEMKTLGRQAVETCEILIAQ